MSLAPRQPPLQRRKWIQRSAAALLVLPALAVLTRRAVAQAAGPEQVFALTARRFQYTPDQIQVKAGQPVVLELSAIDFMHGFSIPDLKLRADLPPGRITRVRFTLDKPGTYEFLCDNFCGDEHELMSGKIVAV